MPRFTCLLPGRELSDPKEDAWALWRCICPGA